MILFKSSHPHKQKEITELFDLVLLESEVTFLDEITGYLYEPEDSSHSLRLLSTHLIAEGQFTLTMLETFEANHLAMSCLQHLHQSTPGAYQTLGDCLFLAITDNNSTILNQAINFYESLPENQIEMVVAYVKSGGNIKKTAQQLFIHRNTVTNHLRQFEHETSIDLKDENQRFFLRILDLYIHDVHDAQDIS